MALIVINLLTGTLTFIYVTVVLFFRRGWLRLPVFRSAPVTGRTKVSVLIAARNEEEKIAFTIRDVLAQTYPAELLELIVVDDHSTDSTSQIVQSFAAQGVILIRLNEKEKLNSYKKKAISEAIRVASGELIVTTDADCRMNEDWIKTIVSCYEQNDLKMLSSPVVYHEESSFFERLQTLEFLYLIGLGASSIGNKIPSTCNGANLAYRKDVFEELGGFKGIDDLASGDDELFLHKVASRYPDGIGFCKSYRAVVFTTAKSTLREFIRQRKRWASKSTRYKNKSIVLLGVLIWLFNCMLLLTMVAGFYDRAAWHTCLLAFAFKYLAETAFLVPVTRFARRKELIWYLPLLTVIHTVYMIYIGLAGNSGKYVWKGRLVR
ncbi:glycosyltransferase [Arcticibacter sp. MXS-1]|uniref:glycosyltransferase family 2 protein n=1 Tax=Arcticibacter sp. MXS-1 TaxID=3341726 RepID=UPI0035A979B4